MLTIPQKKFALISVFWKPYKLKFRTRKQSVAQLVVWENLLLHGIQPCNAISTCSKIYWTSFIKSILVFCNFTDLQKLQRAKRTWMYSVKHYDYSSFQPNLKYPRHCRKLQHTTKYIALREHNEDYCASDTLDSDYSGDGNIRKNFLFLPYASLLEAKYLHRIFGLEKTSIWWSLQSITT